MSGSLIEELAALDADEQREWQEAAKSGEDFEAAYLRVREKYRERFLDIVKRNQDAPVYRIQCPALHT